MKALLAIIFVFCFSISFSQTVKNDTISDSSIMKDITAANKPAISPKFSPIRAGLYSAVLPGLGQFYNKKYWKIPIVWGAVGTGVAIILYNQKQYNRYRNDFIAELNGQPQEFSGVSGVDANVLGNAQDSAKRYRDYAIAITGIVYILNIVDAVVDAHLYQGRHDPDLSLSPVIIQDGASNKTGIALNLKF